MPICFFIVNNFFTLGLKNSRIFEQRNKDNNSGMEKDELKKILDDHKTWLSVEGGQRAYLRWADLRGADLRGADLQGAYLQEADLQEADLRWADLRGADLRGADLRGADLRGANLQGAYLQEADLQEADLRWADLRGADLRGADLRGANLQGAEGIFQFGPVDTSGRICYAVKHENGWMINAGCFWGSVDELEKMVNESHKSPVYLAICQMLKNWK